MLNEVQNVIQTILKSETSALQTVYENTVCILLSLFPGEEPACQLVKELSHSQKMSKSK